MRLQEETNMNLITYKILQEGARKAQRQYNDFELKQKVCSHIEQDMFINNQGVESRRCKACQKWSFE